MTIRTARHQSRRGCEGTPSHHELACSSGRCCHRGIGSERKDPWLYRGLLTRRSRSLDVGLTAEVLDRSMATLPSGLPRLPYESTEIT